MAGFVMVVAVMAVSGFIGFVIGHESAVGQKNILEQRVKALEAERAELQDSVTALGAEAATAAMRLEDLQETFEEAVPAGPVEGLISLVRKQVEEGMDPERMAFLIRSARPPRNCTEPVAESFVVSTPAYEGPEGQADIADGAILIKGSGSSARNEKGENEAWYDSGKPVDLVFTIGGDKVLKKSGAMPIYQTIIHGDKEYRFTVSEGARSFAKVTYDSCDYP